MITVACCQYQFSEQTFAAWQQKIIDFIADEQADIIVFPEYLGIEMSETPCEDDRELFALIQPRIKDYIEFFAELAKQRHCYILAGTIPVAIADHRYINRAYFFAPDGEYYTQDKNFLTAYEADKELLAQGEGIHCIVTPWAKIGIAICYDVEFPALVRTLVRQGADLILVPSYTISSAGFTRVNTCARARAIENQCYVATACVVGPVSHGVSAPEYTSGRAGVYTPADMFFPSDGVLVQGDMDRPCIVSAELDFGKLSWVREYGDVRNYVDQVGALLEEI